MRRDFQALLSSDRKRMVLLNYAAGFASLPCAEEQTAVALLFCNISSQHMGRSWLLYFSRWAMAGTDGGQTPERFIAVLETASTFKKFI